MNLLEESILESSRNIFVLYLIVSGNFLANLFGCRTQKAFGNEMWLKHLLGFMTLYFFVALVNTKSTYFDTPQSQLGFSFLCYIIFLISARMDYKWWVVFILTLAVIYILQVYKEHKNTEEKTKDDFTNYQKYLAYFSFAVLILGFVIYIGKKKVEYKNAFNWLTFILGKPNCTFSAKDVPLTDYEGFVKAFE
jgi:integral membrane sensor domain MASE1